MPIFARFENPVRLRAVLDQSALAVELAGLLEEMTGLSDKILCEKTQASPTELAPYLEIQKVDGAGESIRFYTMPGGHEFNSFILALYNMAGPGKAISQEEMERISAIDTKVDIKVLISLSCTMCPEVVVGTGKIASLNANVRASAIDIAHFPDLKAKYNVMSVPCMIINDQTVHFGKKNIGQIIDSLKG